MSYDSFTYNPTNNTTIYYNQVPGCLPAYDQQTATLSFQPNPSASFPSAGDYYPNQDQLPFDPLATMVPVYSDHRTRLSDIEATVIQNDQANTFQQQYDQQFKADAADSQVPDYDLDADQDEGCNWKGFFLGTMLAIAAVIAVVVLLVVLL